MVERQGRRGAPRSKTPLGPSCSSSFGVSVVIPTKNESPNIVPLVQALNDLPVGCLANLLFVDDSDDDTCDQIEMARSWSKLPITLVHRTPEERRGGLGGAVLTGIERSNSSWVCIMDGDLQHPPDVIPALVAQARQSNAGIVIGTRFAAGGQINGLGWVRKRMSRVLTWLTRWLFSARLAAVSDPLSGFFLVRRSLLVSNFLRPNGYKILLEILVQHPPLEVREVGFAFDHRMAGTSKARFREGLRFINLLWRLKTGDSGGRFLRFMAVGASGFIVHLGLAALVVYLFGASYLVAALLATQGSTLWNFIGYDRWVFRDRAANRSEPESLAKTFLVNNGAFLFRGPVIYLLTELLRVQYLPAIFFSLVMFTVLRYAVASTWIWPSSRRQSEAQQRSFGE